MDFFDGTPGCWTEGSVLTTSSYFTSWPTCPGMAFRNDDRFRAMLDAVPPRCDLYVERFAPAMTCGEGSFITDPIVAGYWIQHQDHLSRAQHPDQPRQTVVMLKTFDEMVEQLSDQWPEHLKAWAQLLPGHHILNWIQTLDFVAKEARKSDRRFKSRFLGPVQKTLLVSLQDRIKWGKPVSRARRAYDWAKKAIGAAAF